MSDKEEQIIEVVDEFADELDPLRIENESERLGITPEEMLERVKREVLSRISDTPVSA